MIDTGQLVLLVSPKGKRYLRMVEEGEDVHTHDGRMSMADIAEAGYGRRVSTHMGRPYLVLRPTLYDLIKGVKRQTQIMYPKEIGYVLLKLGVAPGMTVLESGTGSGGLTTALAWTVGDTGKVITYERREDFYNLAGKNLKRVGLDHRVEQVNANIEDGFHHTGADALFLDVRTPWEYLEHIPAALNPGSMCGFLLPTTNQVSDLLWGLNKGPFLDVEVLEVLVRRWKPVPDRLRPDDRMVAHTAFLIFARYMDMAVYQSETEEEPEAEAVSEPVAEPAADVAEEGAGESAEGPETPAKEEG